KYIADYFPGPDIYEHDLSSNITQPPVAALGLEYLLKKNADREWAKKQVAKIEKSHQFFYENRDPLKKNLVAIVHPWESGMDNAVSWDRPLKNVSTVTKNEINRIDTKKVTDLSQRPSDDEYARYIHIVESLNQNDLKPTSFCVYDPMMTTVLALSEMALANVCEKLEIETHAKERANKLVSSLESIQSPDGRSPYIDALTNKQYHSNTLASLFPLLVTKDKEQAEAILKQHLGEHGLSTHSLKDDSFDSRCYWRGPCWVNTNWFFKEKVTGLAEKTIKLIEKSGFYEYFDPITGEGLGSDNFTWSAALFLCLNDQ
ncbi:MAG: MGH1-like glycoside hydrolase domain-containing protein, partial [Bacteriovoracaceae bacterium]